MNKYLMLDKDDITKICGVVTQKELLKSMTHSQINTMLINSKPYQGKYILIEDECEKKEETFKDIRICDGKTCTYYASRNGEFFVKYANGTIRQIKKFKDPYLDYALVTINKRNYRAKNLIAKYFIKEFKKNDVVIQKNGDIFDCRVENLKVVPRKAHSKRKCGLGRAKKVGLYQNGKLVKTWDSTRRCAKDLFCCYRTISKICNEKVKDKLFDVRWL